MARGHEPDRYTAGEAAQLTYLVSRLAVAMQKGGNAAKWDRKITELQASAVAREEDERAEREARTAARRKELADKRAARRIW